MNFLYELKNSKQFFLILFIAYLFIYFPVITSGFFQNDDLGRSYLGYYRWEGDGRFLADSLVKLFVGSGGVFNVSPLFQLLSLVCMSLSSLLIIKAFDIKDSAASFLALIAFYSTTNYIENISHIYDSFPMFASIFSSVVAFYLLAKSKVKFSFVVSVLFVFFSLNLYQVGVNVFLVLAFAYGAVLSIREEDTKAYFIKILVVIGLSLFLYKIAIFLFYNLESYAASKSSVINFFERGLVIKDTALSVFKEVAFLSSYRKIFMLSLLFVLFCPILALLTLRVSLKSKFVALLYFGLCALSVPGVLLLLDDPVVAPRTLVAFGALVSSSLIFILCINNKVWKKVIVIPSILIAISNIGFTYGHGMYQRSLQAGIDITYPRIAEIINNNAFEGEVVYNLGEPNIMQENVANGKYRSVMNHISYQPLQYGNWWGYVAMQKYGFNGLARYSTEFDLNIVCDLARSAQVANEYPELDLKILRYNNNVYLSFENKCR